ncbi:MAG: GNAT family N-acetyltransferase [Oscillospiraceae bacterium]|nr:GNAT family N-acetyltransferase [Oscillospiraceae bacterium]
MHLETKRLFVREFIIEDAQAMKNFASDEYITKWLPDWCDCSEWIDDWINMVINHYTVNDPMKNFLAYAVVEKESNSLIGHIGCGAFEEFEEAEMGLCYVINPAYANRGYTTEALNAFVGHLFDRYCYDYLIATIQPDNIASIIVAKKIGFVFTKSIEIIDNGQTEKLPFNYYRLHRI